MRPYTVFVDELAKNSFQIAVSPSSRSAGAMATRGYVEESELARDLFLHVGYSSEAVRRFFDSNDRHHALAQYPLTDETAHYLGWLSEYDRA